MSAALVWVGMGLLGGAGACARFMLGTAVSRRAPGDFPWGTFAVNVLGCLALGVLAGRHVTGDALLLAGTATLGAFTTFSTWMLEAHRLIEAHRARTGGAYLAASLVVGAVAFVAGRAAGGW